MKTAFATTASILRRLTCVMSPLLLGALSLGCVAAGAPDKEGEHVDDTHLSFEEFEAMTYREPDTGIYIIDGDVPVEGIEALREIYAHLGQPGALTINSNGGSFDKWVYSTQISLTYCVSLSMPSRSSVLTAMAQAGDAWHAAAAVKFVHLASQDALCGTGANQALFSVLPTSGQSFLARAFFPSSTDRTLLINSTAFGTIAPWTLTGILRHELGHVLGFRHEQVRLGFNVPSGCFEDTGWLPVTTYDSASVMHYPQCSGTNTGDLVLTTKDIAGAASVYGAPFFF